MKKATFIALIALGVAAVAIPDAQGIDGQTLDVRIAGSNFITSDENGEPTPLGLALVAMQNGIAKGSGASSFTSNAELEAVPLDPSQFPPACLAQGQAGAGITVTFVLVYKDGSLLSLFAGPGSFFCTDGTNFTANLDGNVTGGDGRFAGATGSFSGTAFSSPPRVTGDLAIDLN